LDLIIWAQLVLFCVLMLLSGFFSSSETSLFSLSQVQLQQLRRDNNPRVGLIEHLLSQPRRLIVTILIGNELVNVAASVISAAAVIHMLGDENKWVNLFVMVPILLLFGEITPKTLAIRNNVAFATFQSPLIDLFARIILPVRWLVREVSDVIITLIVGKERSRDNIITEDMVRSLAREALGEGALDRQEAHYIEQIFEVGDLKLDDIMTPRSQVVAFPIELSLEEMARELMRTRHSKVPVYRDNLDAIEGVLFARDLLGVDLSSGAGPTPADLLRKAYFVPETRGVSDLLHTFRDRNLSLALTVDEYGGVTGLVTMEDLLECIFGDIPSRSEVIKQEQVEFEDLGGGRYRVGGSMSLQNFNELVGTEFDDEEVETIGGILLHEFGELPAEGARIVIGEHAFTVISLDHHLIQGVAVEPVTPIEPPSETAEA
jgi:CBS domain containing-hemolysin-like protein